MNYQMEVKSKIDAYPVGKLIVANIFLQEKLEYVPPNSYYKSLERMVKKGELSKISKGVYCRPKITRFGKIPVTEENILNYYVGEKNMTGVVIGYRLYNKYGITNQVSKTIEVYSNVLQGKKKVIQNIIINKINLSINSETKRVIEQLEILQNYNNIEDINKNRFRAFIKTIVQHYCDQVFIKVVKNMNYKKSTIAFLENILNQNNVRNTLSQFLNKTSKYKFPKMEELYETAYK